MRWNSFLNFIHAHPAIDPHGHDGFGELVVDRRSYDAFGQRRNPVWGHTPPGPGGTRIGQAGASAQIRVIQGGATEARMIPVRGKSRGSLLPVFSR